MNTIGCCELPGTLRILSWCFLLSLYPLLPHYVKSLQPLSHVYHCWYRSGTCSSIGTHISARTDNGFIADSCQLIEYQLLLAVESLGYHSAAVYVPCDEEGDVFNNFNDDQEELTNSRSNMKILCEYTCPTQENTPTGRLSTFDISTDDRKLGLLVFAESGIGDGQSNLVNNENVGNIVHDVDSNEEEVEVVDEILLHKRERLLGSSLSSIRLILKALISHTMSSDGDSDQDNFDGSSTGHGGMYLANEASSMIVTTRTLLKMIGKRLKGSDEIGQELLHNVYVQLDSLSILTSKKRMNDVDSTMMSPSQVVAELADDVDHAEDLPLNIVSYDESNDGRHITKDATASSSPTSRKATVNRIDDEFWSASKQEVVIEIEDNIVHDDQASNVHNEDENPSVATEKSNPLNVDADGDDSSKG